jgi:hypothetical protein
MSSYGFIFIGMIIVFFELFWANREWKKYKSGEGYWYTGHAISMAAIVIGLAIMLSGIMTLIKQ